MINMFGYNILKLIEHQNIIIRTKLSQFPWIEKLSNLQIYEYLKHRILIIILDYIAKERKKISLTEFSNQFQQDYIT